ncbi:MAG: hypothetical protein ABSH14_13715 [Verrucomicrobiia bacterium]|jgi:hypothetical protein
MSYRYRATERFWTNFYRLSPSQKEATRAAWKIFKVNPFDPRLRPHKIQRLSGHYGRTIHAIEIEGDLRSIFCVEGDTVISLTIGTHAIYQG